MKKKSRSFISMVLVVVLVVSMMPVFSFAGTAEPDTKCVFLGDSMSQGYLFMDYIDGDCGWQGASERSAIKLFRKYLIDNQIIEGESDFVDLSMQGMQADMIWAMTRGYNGQEDQIEELQLSFNDVRYLDWHKNSINDPSRCKPGGEYASLSGYELLNRYYLDNIKDADILVYDLGMGNFGIYMFDRIQAVIAGNDPGYSWETLSSLMDCMTPEQKSAVAGLRTQIEAMIEGTGMIPDGIVDKAYGLVDTLLYSYASYIYYNDKLIDWIYKNNKNKENLKLIVSGLYNPMQNIKLQIPVGENAGETVTIDLSAILQALFDSATLYVSSINKYANRYAFADMMDKDHPIEAFVGEYRRCGQNPEEEILTDDAKCNAYSVLDSESGVHDNTYRPIAVALYNEPIESLNGDQQQLRKFIEAFSQECCEAMQIDEYPLPTILGAFQDKPSLAAKLTSLVGEIQNNESINNDEYMALNLALMFNGARNFGCHPSVRGHENKAKSFIEAYEDFDKGISAKVKTDGRISKQLREAGNRVYDFIADNGSAGMEIVIGLAVQNGLLDAEYVDEINNFVGAITDSMKSGKIKKAHDLCNELAETYEKYVRKSIKDLLNNDLIRSLIDKKIGKNSKGYVYIGDSFARGYAATNTDGLKIIDTSTGNDIIKDNGVYKYAVNTASSYPYYVARKLGLSPGSDTEITKNVKFWPVAYNAFSTKALLGLLGEDKAIFEDDGLYGSRRPTDRYDYLYDCYGNANSYHYVNGNAVKDTNKAAKFYDLPTLLKDSSVVTVELGMADVIYKLQTDAENADVNVNDIKEVASVVSGLIFNYEKYYKDWTKSYKKLSKKIKEYSSQGKAKVVLIGVMNPLANVMINDDVLLPLGSAFNLMTDRMNSVIEKCARDNGFIYIDINNVDTPATSKIKHLTVESLMSLLQDDETDALAIATHPTKEGYEQIGRMIVAAVNEELAKEKGVKPVTTGTDIKVDIGTDFRYVNYVKVDGKTVSPKNYSVRNHVLTVKCDRATAKTMDIAIARLVKNNGKMDLKVSVMNYTLKYDNKSGYSARRTYVTNDAVATVKTTVKTVTSAVKDVTQPIAEKLQPITEKIGSTIKGWIENLKLPKLSY